MHRNLSTLTEILARGEIFDISCSYIKLNTYIVQFYDGSQANIDKDVLKTLNAIRKEELRELAKGGIIFVNK